ncbi:MAG: 4-hydroxy-tetrahydrodipicolinate synthase [Planctomycetes bacterium]|nr:4-hydroxy-tetrahydrodipicolinate synthase [Planctomycetota bacterium]
MTADFSGLSVALATPFTARGEVDHGAFRKLCRHVRDGGARTLVVLGSTGEAATITAEERDPLITACLEEAGAAQVVVGTGHNATRQTIAWTVRARALGAHGALVVTPYYNKPTEAGLLAHFEAIAEAVPEFPLIAYNVPGRTGQNVAPSTLAKLWRIPSVVALKESSGNLAQIGEIARTLPAGKQLLSGDDYAALATIALGGSGLVSVIGNAKPAETAKLVRAALEGDFQTARRMHFHLLPLMDALFVESNPIPLKAALAHLGLAESHVRLPLTPPRPSTIETMQQLLESIG